ncbi:hypothetical protein AB4Z21_24550, partial [Paenibacillus sp. MCAF20]
ELFESITAVHDGSSPDRQRLKQLYELLLINQFHDILPGTSIPEVHDRAIQEVGEVIASAEVASASLLSRFINSKENAVTAWNTLSWDRNDIIAVKGIAPNLYPSDQSLLSQRIIDAYGNEKLLIGGATVPAMGSLLIPLSTSHPSHAASSPFRYDEAAQQLETPHAIVRFDANGYIESFYDKSAKRELRGAGHPLGALLMGEDLPGAWENTASRFTDRICALPFTRAALTLIRAVTPAFMPSPIRSCRTRQDSAPNPSYDRHTS